MTLVLPDVDVVGAVAKLRDAWLGGGRDRDAPRVGIVLGSGLGALVEMLEDAVSIPMDTLPGLPRQSTRGHEGRMVFGKLDDTEVVVQAGRYHAYEGHPAAVVAAPVRIMAGLGVEVLLVTSAVGGIHAACGTGDIVLLDDQINFSFGAPLAGAVVGSESRFPDMSASFDSELQGIAISVAADLGIDVRRVVYGGVHGPSYETAAEVRMLSRLGVDVVGMSTVQEVIVARASGLRVLGLSLVTNRATGLAGPEIGHDQVLTVGAAATERMSRLVRGVARGIGSTNHQSGDAK